MTEQQARDFFAVAIPALREASVPQCICALHDATSGGYCALGVVLHALGVPDQTIDELDHDAMSRQDFFGRIRQQIADKGYTVADDTLCDITELNDDAGYSFAAIADWLDRYLSSPTDTGNTGEQS